VGRIGGPFAPDHTPRFSHGIGDRGARAALVSRSAHPVPSYRTGNKGKAPALMVGILLQLVAKYWMCPWAGRAQVVILQFVPDSTLS